jgi:hypothetical protein
MKPKTERELQEEAEKFMEDKLRDVGVPCSLQLLMLLAKEDHVEVNRTAMARAVWCLLDLGKIKMTAENKVVIAHANRHKAS